MPPDANHASKPVLLGVALLSAAVLLLQLLAMRCLSFVLWYHLSYLVLSVAMLGTGAAGAHLAMFGERFEPRRTAIFGALLFALTAVAGFAGLSRTGLDGLRWEPQALLVLGLCHVVLALPYFCAGLSVAALLRNAREHTSRLFGASAIGAGLGCQLFCFGLEPLGMEAALLAVSGLGVAAAGCWALGADRRRWLAPASFALLIVMALPLRGELLPFEPAPSKALAAFLGQTGAHLERTRWTPLGRVDVGHALAVPHPLHKGWLDGERARVITLDGDAESWIYDFRELSQDLGAHPQTPTLALLQGNPLALPYLLQHEPRALIIGAGGGAEVAVALAARARHVTAVEQNPAVLAQTTQNYAALFGRLYESGRATAVVAEGRSFVRGSHEQYDVIQLAAVHAASGLSSGAYVLSESYLYTVEALQDFLRQLSPDGVLAISRDTTWPPRESLRLFATTLRALGAQGAQHPAEHLLVISRGTAAMSHLLVKRSPFTREEVGRYVKLLSQHKQEGDVLWYAPHIAHKLEPTPYLDLVQAVAHGPAAEAAFHDGYRYDVTPTYDDRPFFFESNKWKNLVRDWDAPGLGGTLDAKRPVALLVLGAGLVLLSLLALLCIVLPLRHWRRQGAPLPHGRMLALGAGALGLGFTFLAIALMQRLVLFLGDPVASISITLSALLVASGFGAVLVRRLPCSVPLRLGAALGLVAVLTALYALGLGPLTDALLDLAPAVRELVVVALVSLLGVPLGMPLPLALERAGSLAPTAVPYALGVNAALAVLGSMLAIVVALAAGFQLVLLLAALLYLLALPCLLPLWREA